MGTYKKSAAEGLKPSPNLTVSEWADQYRIIPVSGLSVEPGKWKTSRTPYTREIMDCLSPQSPHKKVVVMKPSQSAGSEVGINWILRTMHIDPCGIMCAFPTIAPVARRWSIEKLMPNIVQNPSVADLVDVNSRDSTNTILHKNFRGGFIAMAGSNSGASLRMLTYKYLYADEISDFAVSTDDGMGDPLLQAERGCANFFDSKIYYVSTPGIKGACRIEHEYLLSDQRKYHVPCPFCGQYQVLEWKNIIFDKDDMTKPVQYACCHCGELIDERYKTQMLAGGRWVKRNPKSEVAGFWWNRLYNPIGWYSWKDIVQEFLNAQKDVEKLKIWTNQSMAETWEISKESIDSIAMIESSEMYKAEVPAGAMVLTAGIDVQENRIEMSVIGWGTHFHGYVINHKILYGDPAQPDVWLQLDDEFFKQYQHELGSTLNIATMCIDTGGRKPEILQQVYKYVSQRKHLRIYAVKGSSVAEHPVFEFNRKPNEFGIHICSAGTNKIKDALYAKFNTGQFHFPDFLPPEYYEQLTAEAYHSELRRGVPTRVYTLAKGKRNEALDCAVYCYCAVAILDPAFEVIEKRMYKRAGIEKPEKTETGIPVPQKTTQPDAPVLPDPGKGDPLAYKKMKLAEMRRRTTGQRGFV